MSGGHFQYQQQRLEEIAEEIDEAIESNDDQTIDKWGDKKGFGFPDEIIDKFREAAHTLRRAAEMADRVDYLMSSDDSEKSFLERWEKEVGPSWDSVKHL